MSKGVLKSGDPCPCQDMITGRSVEALQTRTSNEYEEEYGLFLYNAT